MYNGVLDFKRFRKTPLPETPPPIAIRGPKGPTGPSGTPYRPQDVYTGPTGTTGPTGALGPTGTFYGQLIMENLTPINNNISIQLSDINVNEGRFGPLDMSINGVYPVANNTYDLGSSSAQFNNIYARKTIIGNNSLVIRDQSGNYVTMSFDLENYKITYDVVNQDGHNFKLYSIENINNTLDVNLFPYTGLTFYDSVAPVYNILDTTTIDIYTSLPTMDNLEQATTGYYLIINADGRIDTPTQVSVFRDSVLYTFNQEIIGIDSGVLNIDVSAGDMLIMTVYNDISNANTYNVKWSHYPMSYPVDSVSTSYFVNGAVTVHHH